MAMNVATYAVVFFISASIAADVALTTVVQSAVQTTSTSHVAQQDPVIVEEHDLKASSPSEWNADTQGSSYSSYEYGFNTEENVKPWCLQNQFLDSTDMCMNCTVCYPGTEHESQSGCGFGVGQQDQCIPCQDGYYQESTGYTCTLCRPCRVCDTHVKELKACSPTENTQCGPCPPGMFEFSPNVCLECTEAEDSPACLRPPRTTTSIPTITPTSPPSANYSGNNSIPHIRHISHRPDFWSWLLFVIIIIILICVYVIWLKKPSFIFTRLSTLKCCRRTNSASSLPSISSIVVPSDVTPVTCGPSPAQSLMTGGGEISEREGPLLTWNHGPSALVNGGPTSAEAESAVSNLNFQFDNEAALPSTYSVYTSLREDS